MIRIHEGICIGNRDDALQCPEEVGATLNVAIDLNGTSHWPLVEYAQVGLIDGPGNTQEGYSASVMALSMLLQRQESKKLEKRDVMVYCHNGGRSLVVVIMYLHATGAFGLEPSTPTIMHDLFTVPVSYRQRRAAVQARVKAQLPDHHQIHEVAFASMNWRALHGALSWTKKSS